MTLPTAILLKDTLNQGWVVPVIIDPAFVAKSPGIRNITFFKNGHD